MTQNSVARTLDSKTSAVPRYSPTKSNSRPRLLIVDDIEFARLLMKGLLNTKGHYEVLEAETSEAGLQLIRENSGIDLIISDFVRPGMNGLDFLRIVKREWPQIPVLIISGRVDAANRRKAYRLGAHSCLTKPIKYRQFYRAIDRALGIDSTIAKHKGPTAAKGKQRISL